SAPVIRKLFPNQKNEGNRSNRCQRTREPRSGSAYAEELERENDQPIKQRRFLQTRDAVVRWEEPSMSFDHLAGRPCILSRGLALAFGINPSLPIFLPMFRQTQQFSRGHLDQRKHLAALGNQRAVLRSCDPECAPEPRACHLIEPAINHQPVSEFGCAAIINL